MWVWASSATPAVPKRMNPNQRKMRAMRSIPRSRTTEASRGAKGSFCHLDRKKGLATSAARLSVKETTVALSTGAKGMGDFTARIMYRQR